MVFQKGHKVSKEMRRKISMNTRKGMQKLEIIEKMRRNYKYHINSGCFKKGHKKGMLGKSHSDITKRKLSKTQKIKPPFRAFGKDNPAWKGGKSRKPYSLDFNPKLKLIIQFRDNFVCQWCGQKEIKRKKRLLHIHHIDNNKNNQDWNNLITICSPCHLAYHKQP